MLKRTIALFLTVVLLFGILPAPVSATESEQQIFTDSGDVSIEGTNGFGTLLSESITENQEQMETEEGGYAEGYSVTDLVIKGSSATVTYDSLERAMLVVALYSEDGRQLLTSATAEVTPEDTEATVTFDGQMPEYFMASAYLMDTYDLSPLCPAYDTPLYTREMQELLASTVEDYDSDRVLNLDDDNTTNFAVYAEGTIVIEEQTGVNTVASVNDDTATYVIENANESITGLQIGDVFAYPYGENDILIVKVAAITVDGTTATITGDDLEMNEAFSQVKLETFANTSDFIVDEATGDEGVVYQPGEVSTFSRAGGSQEAKLEFGFDDVNVGNGIKLSGGLASTIKLELSYYITWSYQEIKFALDFGGEFNIKLSGKCELFEIELPGLALPPVWGIFISFNPRFVIKSEVSIDFTVSLTQTTGFKYSSDSGFSSLSTKPKVDTEWSFKGKIFLGIDFGPSVEVAGGYLLNLRASMTAGAEIQGQPSNGSGTDGYRHLCNECLDGDISGKLKITASLVFLKSEKLKLEEEICNTTVHLFDFYYSSDKDQFGLGVCPNRSFKVTFQVLTREDAPASYAKIEIEGIDDTLRANADGIAEGYLPAGTYNVKASTNEMYSESQFSVKAPRKVILSVILDWNSGGPGGNTGSGGILGTIDSEEITDKGAVADSGSCGENVYWKLYNDGLLDIYGSGAMKNYDYVDDVQPWYNSRSTITSAVIGDGVTSIGYYAFYGCSSLTSITIPDSVTRIGGGVFEDCRSLTSITIPDGVTSIGEDAFCNCSSLTSITIPDSVTSIGGGVFEDCSSLTSITIPDSVTVISNSAFSGCSSLTSITIPDGVTSIENYAFYRCSSLTEITLPDRLTTIDLCAFQYCSSLTTITIPDSVTSICPGAFSNCSSLISITIPDGVTSIGSGVFEDCRSLTSITIPDGVTSIGDSAFAYCESLTGISIPDSVISIGDSAFFDCGSLTSITIPDGVSSIGSSTFYECNSLTSITIPDSVSSIGSSTFYECNSLTSITIPDSVTSIGNHAFYGCSSLTDVYYTGTVEQWNAISIEGGNTCLTNATIHYNSGRSDQARDSISTENDGVLAAVNSGPDEDHDLTLTETDAPANQEETGENAYDAAPDPAIEPLSEETQPAIDFSASQEVPTLDAVYGGEYGTEVTDTYTLKTASFTGLVPGEQYVLLALVSLEAENPLEADNLLYIDQNAALEDGTLRFRYIQRTPTDTSYVVACGASNKNLEKAVITFPEMTATGELQAVNPTVVYDGEALTEGADYTLAGTVSFSKPGTYTCSVRGIHNYTGLVTCTYSVGGDMIASGACGENLTWVLNNNGALTISGTGAMDDFSRSETPWYDYRGSITSVAVESGVTKIGAYAFHDCSSLTSITIPDSVTTIGDYAFYGCSSLANISIPDSVMELSYYCFEDCTSLSKVTLPAKLQTIGGGAFQNCTNLQEIEIPDSVMTISYQAFSNCNTLSSVKLPEALEELDDRAFSNCTSLTELNIPDGVMEMSYYCFENCTSLQSIKLPSALYGIDACSFNNCSALSDIEFPEGLNWIKPGAFYGCEALSDIYFTGDVPVFYDYREWHIFQGVVADAYYPENNTTWTEDDRQNYGGTITWIPYDPNGGASDDRTVKRISGKTRIETALEVAKTLKEALGVEKFDTIIIANGEDARFADALTGSYLANVKGAPILMYTKNANEALTTETMAFIQENLSGDGVIYLLGGDAALPENVKASLADYTVERLSGKTRFDTNLRILEEAGIGEDQEILIARGYNFADSLSASATGLPILVVNDSGGKLTEEQIAFLEAHKSNPMTILGGTGGISEDLEAKIEEIVGKNIERVYGKSRENTSVAIAERYFPKADFAVVAYSRGSADGLCGGPLAYAKNAPLLLTASGMESVTNAYIASCGITAGYILGGTAAISADTAGAVFDTAETK